MNEAAADVIQLIRRPDGGCYLARYLSGPTREKVVGAFGTDTVPLPWHHSADPEVVLLDVGRRNPFAKVRPCEIRSFGAVNARFGGRRAPDRPG